MAQSHRSRRWILGVSLLGLGLCSSANADWHTFWHEVRVGYARNNAWPQPFADVDAKDVQKPMDIMIHNGWRAHNTIGSELFRENDSVLTLAGARRVHWIATHSPASRRTIYVFRGATEQETSKRLDSVHQTLASIHSNGPMPQVLVTDIEPSTSSGAWATSINRQWMENLPAPKLPSSTASGSEGAVQ
jgi:hypothetical protein